MFAIFPLIKNRCINIVGSKRLNSLWEVFIRLPWIVCLKKGAIPLKKIVIQEKVCHELRY